MTKQQVNVSISDSWVDQLKTIARKESAKQDKDISYHDVIRQAIQSTYNLQDDSPN